MSVRGVGQSGGDEPTAELGEQTVTRLGGTRWKLNTNGDLKTIWRNNGREQAAGVNGLELAAEVSGLGEVAQGAPPPSGSTDRPIRRCSSRNTTSAEPSGVGLGEKALSSSTSGRHRRRAHARPRCCGSPGTGVRVDGG